MVACFRSCPFSAAGYLWTGSFDFFFIFILKFLHYNHAGGRTFFADLTSLGNHKGFPLPRDSNAYKSKSKRINPRFSYGYESEYLLKKGILPSFFLFLAFTTSFFNSCYQYMNFKSTKNDVEFFFTMTPTILMKLQTKNYFMQKCGAFLTNTGWNHFFLVN